MARLTWDGLKAAFADNTSGDITAGDMRDFVDSVSGHVAAGAPGTGNDASEGFDVGAVWVDVSDVGSPVVYVCVSNTVGAAVWTPAGGGNDYYDLQLGFVGAPAAGAADLILVPRPIVISSADPGDVYTGVNPASTASLDVQVNGVSRGTIEISAAGVVSWAFSGDVNLSRGDRLALVAPDPADSTLADVIVALRGEAA